MQRQQNEKYTFLYHISFRCQDKWTTQTRSYVCQIHGRGIVPRDMFVLGDEPLTPGCKLFVVKDLLDKVDNVFIYLHISMYEVNNYFKFIIRSCHCPSLFPVFPFYFKFLFYSM